MTHDEIIDGLHMASGIVQNRQALLHGKTHGRDMSPTELCLDSSYTSAIDACAAATTEIQRLGAQMAEIERAADLDADIIEAQRAVVQQLASRPVCNWAGQCKHQRRAPVAAPEQSEPARGPTWLTDEQIAQIIVQTWSYVDIAPQSAAAFARAIEAWMLCSSNLVTAAPDDAPKGCPECGQLGWHKMSCSHVAHERGLRVTEQSSDSTSCPRGER